MIRTRVFTEDDSCVVFPIDDRIFLGEGLFETLKVEGAKPCYANLHWQRLSESAPKMGIPFDLSYEQWLEHLLHKIKRDNLYHGGLKAILSGGSAPRGLGAHGQISHLAFQTFNYTVETHPLRLVSASWLRDENNPVYQVKSVNYLEAILARRQANATGADDALFFNLQHHATETTCANLFLIKNQSLMTPPLGDGVLPGITRSRVLQLSTQQGIMCKEISLTKPMLEEADALFVTNSLQGIRPICSLDNREFNVSHPLLNQLSSFLSI
ncbi:aminotransferase class IV [Fluoribacter dumoffii]|uniref:Aminodeoxychorismate lyase n=1 Tax=Fluoribacter dumoffii TaxID=463 RepID=A0A377GDJ6_9GAMM|nr:aminotransferase class IV [Fluoribacter dumoffii]KTC90978.1 aminodeoxychorismate lyase [Fluoribacter dumoffii NY 23]MCW8386547.1 aminotransferase class IV [Fluoribacter dumoffii]MCW8419601.1 aminotransferase class IV [Fluoribacter dumoffii]MCW8455696.1 aminotransferase class IV [Fluoribacter dumoffii]MCW8460225.1 aminotransferase class IV [Fluoribacter dumoffii]